MRTYLVKKLGIDGNKHFEQIQHYAHTRPQSTYQELREQMENLLLFPEKYCTKTVKYIEAINTNKPNNNNVEVPINAMKAEIKAYARNRSDFNYRRLNAPRCLNCRRFGHFTSACRILTCQRCGQVFDNGYRLFRHYINTHMPRTIGHPDQSTNWNVHPPQRMAPTQQRPLPSREEMLRQSNENRRIMRENTMNYRRLAHTPSPVQSSSTSTTSSTNNSNNNNNHNNNYNHNNNRNNNNRNNNNRNNNNNNYNNRRAYSSQTRAYLANITETNERVQNNSNDQNKTNYDYYEQNNNFNQEMTNINDIKYDKDYEQDFYEQMHYLDLNDDEY
jgi:ribosomal protein L37AE/L43A